MKSRLNVAYSFAFAALLCSNFLTASIQQLYKSIGDQLVTIKKEHPSTQQKVYSILDQVNKMYALAKSTTKEKELLKNDIKIKESESLVLQDELLKAKKASLDHVYKLKEISENLEKEKRERTRLSEEKKKMLEQKKEKQKEKELKKALKDLEQNELEQTGGKDVHQELAGKKEVENRFKI